MLKRHTATTGPGEPVFLTIVEPMLRPTIAQRIAARPAFLLFDVHDRALAGKMVVAVTCPTLRACDGRQAIIRRYGDHPCTQIRPSAMRTRNSHSS